MSDKLQFVVSYTKESFVEEGDKLKFVGHFYGSRISSQFLSIAPACHGRHSVGERSFVSYRRKDVYCARA